VAAGADNTTAYVTDWFSDAISTVDIQHDREIRQISVGAGPRDLIIVPFIADKH